ncbi:retrotransposon protein, putative, ty1-copia subclass [Tanacetum coccineum]
MVRSMMNLTTLSLSFWDYALESATRILNMVPTKKVDKTDMNYGPYILRIQDEDTSPSEITSEIPMEVEGFEPPQEEVIPIDDLNAEITMCAGWDNMVWVLVNLPPGCKTVGKTFSPVNDIRAIRILISIAAYYDYKIWQMDVKTTFLNGYLNEDIYMVQPEGEATFILGIKIYKDRSKRLVGLGQNTYMDKILKRYKMDNSKHGHILMQERLDLNKTQGASTPKKVKRMQNVPYASAVRSIMYAVRCTRPDVTFAQNITIQFQQNHGELHWTAVKNILKYLRNTKDMFLVYGGNPEAEL